MSKRAADGPPEDDPHEHKAARGSTGKPPPKSASQHLERAKQARAKALKKATSLKAPAPAKGTAQQGAPSWEGKAVSEVHPLIQPLIAKRLQQQKDQQEHPQQPPQPPQQQQQQADQAKPKPRPKQKQKQSAPRATPAVSPYPLPVQVKKVYVPHLAPLQCAGCPSDLQPAQMSAGARVFGHCLDCDSAFCPSCVRNHAGYHDVVKVILCSICGTLHAPLEAACPTLWCRLCGAQSHAGPCKSNVARCDVCGPHCDHSTQACPSATGMTGLDFEQPQIQVDLTPVPGVGGPADDPFVTFLQTGSLPESHSPGPTGKGILGALFGVPFDVAVEKASNGVKGGSSGFVDLACLQCPSCGGTDHFSCGASEPSLPDEVRVRTMCFKCHEGGHITSMCHKVRKTVYPSAVA